MRLPPSPRSARQTYMPDLGFLLDGEERWMVEVDAVDDVRDLHGELLVVGSARNCLGWCAA